MEFLIFDFQGHSNKYINLRNFFFRYDLLNEPFPMCQNLKFLSDSYWECFIRHLTMTMYHPVGTCALGSVVDPELRVQGVDNLRVADASVMPQIISGNNTVLVF